MQKASNLTQHLKGITNIEYKYLYFEAAIHESVILKMVSDISQSRK